MKISQDDVFFLASLAFAKEPTIWLKTRALEAASRVIDAIDEDAEEWPESFRYKVMKGIGSKDHTMQQHRKSFEGPKSAIIRG